MLFRSVLGSGSGFWFRVPGPGFRVPGAKVQGSARAVLSHSPWSRKDLRNLSAGNWRVSWSVACWHLSTSRLRHTMSNIADRSASRLRRRPRTSQGDLVGTTPATLRDSCETRWAHCMKLEIISGQASRSSTSRRICIASSGPSPIARSARPSDSRRTSSRAKNGGNRSARTEPNGGRESDSAKAEDGERGTANLEANLEPLNPEP